MGILALQAAHYLDGFLVASFAAQKQRDHRPRLYVGYGSPVAVVREQRQAVALRTGYACEPYQEFKGQWESSNYVLVDSHYQLCVHVVRVKLQYPCLVFLGLERQAKAASISALHHRQVSTLEGACPTASIQGIYIVGVPAQSPVRLADRFVGQRQYPVARLGVFLSGMFAGEKAIVRIEGSVQQILTVEFLEHHSLKQKRRGLRIAGVRGMKALKAFHCSGIVQL